MKRSVLQAASVAAGALALLAALAMVVMAYAAHLPLIAASLLVVTAGAAVIYVLPRFYAWRYILPGIFAAFVFIIVPMLYTVGIGFTNYSSNHLLTYQRATEVLLEETISNGDSYSMQLYAEGERYRFVFTSGDNTSFVSESVALGGPLRIPLTPASADTLDAQKSLTLKSLIALQGALKKVTAVLPDGTELRASSISRFAALRPAFIPRKDGNLDDVATGGVLRPDFKTGYWRRADGSNVAPGFRSYVGFENYVRIFTDRRFLEPFGRVFAWTVTFATLNTLFTFSIGILLAVALNWDALRYRNFYRAMLFLPYAVPAFISIPVFRGLFNENLGEVNMILEILFGIRPGWFSDATLARSLVLGVNTWLGYPYMMILCMGLIKAIPAELYEASALANAGPLTNFFRITLPLIARPIAPLLIASFTTNFNNLTLIALLTGGAPDYLDTQVPVGATDFLASYTYRIAFQDSGQNYALACAISSVVFLIVVGLAVLNLRLFRVGKEAV